jgi:hypothetical protein
MVYNWRKNLGQHLSVLSIKISLIWSEENLLETNDLKNLAQSLYRERRKDKQRRALFG